MNYFKLISSVFQEDIINYIHLPFTKVNTAGGGGGGVRSYSPQVPIALHLSSSSKLRSLSKATIQSGYKKMLTAFRSNWHIYDILNVVPYEVHLLLNYSYQIIIRIGYPPPIKLVLIRNNFNSSFKQNFGHTVVKDHLKDLPFCISLKN